MPIGWYWNHWGIRKPSELPDFDVEETRELQDPPYVHVVVLEPGCGKARECMESACDTLHFRVKPEAAYQNAAAFAGDTATLCRAMMEPNLEGFPRGMTEELMFTATWPLHWYR